MTIEREVYDWIYRGGEYPGRYKIAKYLNMMVDRWYEHTGDGLDILASADLDRVGDVLLTLKGVTPNDVEAFGRIADLISDCADACADAGNTDSRGSGCP